MRRRRTESPCPRRGREIGPAPPAAARRLPFPPAVLEVPDQLLLLRVDRDHRLAGGQMLVRGLVDVLELRVTVRMRGAFLPFARRLQPVAQAVQQPASNSPATPARSAPPPASRDSCTSSAAAGRVAARERIHPLGARPGCRVDPAGCGAVRRQGVGCGPSARRGQSPGAPCESSPEPHRWPRNHRVAAVGERLAAHRRDCARPTRARPRHTSQPGSLPARCLASYLQYDQQPSRWQTSCAQCPKGGISHAIKLTTNSKWSHVGMVLRLPESQAAFLWESTTPNLAIDGRAAWCSTRAIE